MITINCNIKIIADDNELGGTLRGCLGGVGEILVNSSTPWTRWFSSLSR